MLELDTQLDLSKVTTMTNIADELSDEDLHLIAEYLKVQITIDKQSRAEWEHLTEEVIAMSKMEKEEKNTPWEGASNVKDPLTSIAVLQFAARAYPEIVKQGKVVNVEVIGFDPDGTKTEQARRVGMHMNYQLLVESDEWEDSLDNLLHTLPLVGVAFKKTYYDPIKGRNRSELVPYDKLYINANIKSLEDAPQVTHQLALKKNTILERIRSGLYCEIDEEQLDNAPLGAESTKEHSVLECHCTLDLDGDGYEEPYIVVFLEDQSEILRIYARFNSDQITHVQGSDEVACIEPTPYFTDFHCIPNPDGSFYSIGLGHLLFSINDSINSIKNQLIDSGTLANSQTGIAGRGFRLKGGELKLKMGAIKVLDTAMAGPIKDSIHMMQFKEPSSVLIQLLGMLSASGKEVASINDATMGNELVQNVASSVAQSQVEQGTKVFTGIQRRLFRGLKKEFDKWFRLNSVFLDPQQYYQFVGGNQQVSQHDYDAEALNIKPIADPTMASDSIRMAKAEALLKLVEDPVMGPMMNKMAVIMNFLDVLQIPNAETMVSPPNPNVVPPEVLKMQSDMDAKAKQLQIDAHNANTKQLDTLVRAKASDHTNRKTDTASTLDLAKAKAALDKTHSDKYAADLKAGTEVHKQAMGLHKVHLQAGLQPGQNADGGQSKPAIQLPPPASVGDMVADALKAQPPLQADSLPTETQQPQQTGSKPPGEQ